MEQEINNRVVVKGSQDDLNSATSHNKPPECKHVFERFWCPEGYHYLKCKLCGKETNDKLSTTDKLISGFIVAGTFLWGVAFGLSFMRRSKK